MNWNQLPHFQKGLRIKVYFEHCQVDSDNSLCRLNSQWFGSWKSFQWNNEKSGKMIVSLNVPIEWRKPFSTNKRKTSNSQKVCGNDSVILRAQPEIIVITVLVLNDTFVWKSVCSADGQWALWFPKFCFSRKLTNESRF